MKAATVNSIKSVGAEHWNKLVSEDSPFLRHEFLAALETAKCVGEDSGWIPCHLLVWPEDATIETVAESDTETDDEPDAGIEPLIEAAPIAAMPLFLKYHSYGEYVFDWAWADAYQRAGLDYYPKLLCAAPFTPATGPRLLISSDMSDVDHAALSQFLIKAALSVADTFKVSSLHCLFTTKHEAQLFAAAGFLQREGTQFHWENAQYTSFDDYLSAFSSKNRKKVKRERRRVREAGVTFSHITAQALTDEHWETFYEFYRSTIDVRGAIPYLNLAFFKALGETMSERVLLIFAERNGHPIAGTLNLIGRHTLYGRYWGATEMVPDLHFETCYYQSIDYCIEHGLKRFEAGAQGEHKLQRGLLPTATRSAHWVSHPQFANAIEDFLEREQENTDQYRDVLTTHSPFRSGV